MTKIVGIDFGTTNVRIAQWDVDSGENPSSCEIGDGQVSWMPTMIAFRRHDDGSIETLSGEAADELGGVPNVHVVRNIKRYALVSDKYVREQIEWDLQQHGKWWPEWFDPDTHSIRIWDKTTPIEEAIKLILKEAISRSGLAGAAAEWRAGCPVNSDLTYRKALVSALEDLGCTGRIEWTAEEPILLLALGKAMGFLDNGYYLVYDLGGGSFDCAIVEVTDEHLIVLSDEGLSTLGGMDIDDKLTEQLGYNGPPQLLRIAKEQLSSDNKAVNLEGGLTLTTDNVTDALDGLEIIDKTLGAMLNAYHKAQLLMSRPEGRGFGERRESSINRMREDIDQVLVVGGPTQMPYFTDKLEEIFGDGKVITAEDITRAADRTDITDPALTALSHGACYMYDKKYTPLAVDRIPAKITLSLTDGYSVEEDSYEPFQRLPARPPLAPHNGRVIVRRSPYSDDKSGELDSTKDATYSILVTSPDGDILYESGPHNMRMPRKGDAGPRADRIMLIVDRLGSVKVKLGAGYTHVPSPSEDTKNVILNPQWQIGGHLGGTREIEKRLGVGRERLPDKPAAQSIERFDPYDSSVHAAYGDSGRRA